MLSRLIGSCCCEKVKVSAFLRLIHTSLIQPPVSTLLPMDPLCSADSGEMCKTMVPPAVPDMRPSDIRNMSLTPCAPSLRGMGMTPASGIPGLPIGPTPCNTSTESLVTGRLGSSIRCAMSAVFLKTTARPVLEDRDSIEKRLLPILRRAEETAGAVALSKGIKPSATVTQAMVLAVPITPQVPDCARFSKIISRRHEKKTDRWSKLLIHRSDVLHINLSRSIRRPLTPAILTNGKTALFAEIPPINCAGTVLSQPPIATTASTGWALIISSVSIAIKFLRYILELRYGIFAVSGCFYEYFAQEEAEVGVAVGG
ncbi:hypothetical protein KCV07_g368, partial [Aureobasidium melanogenum]